MSGRSSRHSAVAIALLAAGCGKRSSEPAKPEADPVKVTQLAATMAKNVPSPGGARECTPEDLRGGVSMTFRTLMQLAKEKLSDQPEEAAWINSPDFDSPAARSLAEPANAPNKGARHAAAELLAAKFWVAYKVDLVNAPMALGVKELKIGTVNTRVIRYEMNGVPGCVSVFNFQNDRAVSDQAIEVTDKPKVDPAVAKLLREDLVAQYLKLAPR